MKNVAIIVVSDSCSQGSSSDETTPLLVKLLVSAGWQVCCTQVVPDDVEEVASAIRASSSQGAHLVLTSGGTGLGPRDNTPEATLQVVERIVPGIPELFRAQGAQHTPMAWLSRSVAGLYGSSLVVNLPGSSRGARECVELLMPLTEHILHVMNGGSHRGEAS